jgi:hypothetical protein
MSLIAFVMAILVAEVMLRHSYTVTGKNLSLFFLWWHFTCAFILSFCRSLPASLPAAICFLPISFKTGQVLKGRFSNSLACVSFKRDWWFPVHYISGVDYCFVWSQPKHYITNSRSGSIKPTTCASVAQMRTRKTSYAALEAELTTTNKGAWCGASVYYPAVFHRTSNFFIKKVEYGRS